MPSRDKSSLRSLISGKSKAYTKTEVLKIQETIRRRDHGRCVLHGTPNAEVHEMLFRSSSVRGARAVFRPKHMACVCRTCHFAIHHTDKGREVTKKIYAVLKSRFGYVYKVGEKKFEKSAK